MPAKWITNELHGPQYETNWLNRIATQLRETESRTTNPAKLIQIRRKMTIIQSKLDSPTRTAYYMPSITVKSRTESPKPVPHLLLVPLYYFINATSNGFSRSSNVPEVLIEFCSNALKPPS